MVFDWLIVFGNVKEYGVDNLVGGNDNVFGFKGFCNFVKEVFVVVVKSGINFLDYD